MNFTQTPYKNRIKFKAQANPSVCVCTRASFFLFHSFLRRNMYAIQLFANKFTTKQERKKNSHTILLYYCVLCKRRAIGDLFLSLCYENVPTVHVNCKVWSQANRRVSFWSNHFVVHAEFVNHDDSYGVVLVLVYVYLPKLLCEKFTTLLHLMAIWKKEIK